MSSTGYVYIQDMNEQSSAKHGPFYVTNTLEMYHPEIKVKLFPSSFISIIFSYKHLKFKISLLQESNGQVCGGGVSIYYSHTLRLLFYSYVQGKSFIAPLECGQSSVSPVFQINLGRTSGNNSGGSNKGGSGSANQPQPLCQWSEVPNHPGLICSVLQTSMSSQNIGQITFCS
jgi:E3 ubiquitin-protein ligase UBR4